MKEHSAYNMVNVICQSKNGILDSVLHSMSAQDLRDILNHFKNQLGPMADFFDRYELKKD